MNISSRFLTAIVLTALITGPAIADSGDNVSSVNKSIRIDSSSTKGNIDSVNGSITIGANSAVASVESINGAIKLDDGVTVDRNIEAVNGSIKLQQGCEVGENVETVNGGIRLQNTRVAGDVETVNGNIKILEGSEVSGNVVVKEPKGWSHSNRRKPVRVEIGKDVMVHGDLIFQHAVELKLHDTARVGDIIGDEVTILGNS